MNNYAEDYPNDIVRLPGNEAWLEQILHGSLQI